MCASAPEGQRGSESFGDGVRGVCESSAVGADI